MRALAIAFAWAYGLSDWRIGAALGCTAGAVLQARRAMGLRKGGGGKPVWDADVKPKLRNSAGTALESTRTIRSARSLAGERARCGLGNQSYVDISGPRHNGGCDAMPQAQACSPPHERG